MWALVARRGIIGFVVVYFALVYDSDEEHAHLPSDGLRYAIYGLLRKGNVRVEDGEVVGREIWPEAVGDWIEKQWLWYRRKHKEQWDPYNHDGWDESRGRNTLPGVASPPSQMPLEREG